MRKPKQYETHYSFRHDKATIAMLEELEILWDCNRTEAIKMSIRICWERFAHIKSISKRSK